MTREALQRMSPPGGRPLGTRAGTVRSNLESVRALRNAMMSSISPSLMLSTRRNWPETRATVVVIVVVAVSRRSSFVGHVRILRTAVVVEAQHIPQRRQHAVVHVRRGQRHVAQRRRAEAKPSRSGIRLRQQRVFADAFRVEIEVREHRRRRGTGRTRPRRTSRGRGAAAPSARRCLQRESDRTGCSWRRAIRSNAAMASPSCGASTAVPGSKGVLEQRDILRDVPDPGDDRVDRRGLRIGMPPHFFERLDRLEGLRFQAPDPAVPEHRRPRLIDRLQRAVESPSASGDCRRDH